MTLEEVVEIIAKVVHEANRSYVSALPNSSIPVPAEWEAFPEERRASLKAAIMTEIINPLGAVESHDRWSKARLKEGWRYGKTYNLKKKTHPNLVPYDKLPIEERVKDTLFSEIVWVLKSLVTNV